MEAPDNYNHLLSLLYRHLDQGERTHVFSFTTPEWEMGIIWGSGSLRDIRTSLTGAGGNHRLKVKVRIAIKDQGCLPP